jgi:type IV secretion system protein VirD4
MHYLGFTMIGLAALSWAVHAFFWVILGAIIAPVALGAVADLWRLPELAGATWAGRRQLRSEGLRDTSGWPLGEVNGHIAYLPESMQAKHMLLIGPSGMGKTTLMRRIILSYVHYPHPSLIVIDPKGDLAMATAPALTMAGYRVEYFNPSIPEECTTAINSLSGIPLWYDSRADALMTEATLAYLAATRPLVGTDGESFWHDQAANLLCVAAHIRRATYAESTWADVADFLAGVTLKGLGELINQAAAYDNAAIKMRAAQLKELLVNEKARSGVLGTLLPRLMLATDPRVRRAIGGWVGHHELPRIGARDLLGAPVALFLRADGLSDPTLPMLSLALTTLCRGLVDEIPGPGQPLDRPVRVLCDELGNCGPVLHLDRHIAQMRSSDVGFLLSYTSRAQIAMNQGRDAATTIVDNCATAIVLGGTSDEDARWMSARLGQKASWGFSENDRGDRVHHRQLDPLLSADAIRHMKYKAVVDVAGMPPLLVDLVKEG